MTIEKGISNKGTRISGIIHKYFSDYVSRDRDAVAESLSDNFAFHSPHDPDLNKATYFEKCWANGDSYRAIRIEKLFEEGNEAFVRYECETKDGAKSRTTEFFRIEGDKIMEIEVYYGSL
jgi:hypothetical protein